MRCPSHVDALLSSEALPGVEMLGSGCAWGSQPLPAAGLPVGKSSARARDVQPPGDFPSRRPVRRPPAQPVPAPVSVHVSSVRHAPSRRSVPCCTHPPAGEFRVAHTLLLLLRGWTRAHPPTTVVPRSHSFQPCSSAVASHLIRDHTFLHLHAAINKRVCFLCTKSVQEWNVFYNELHHGSLISMDETVTA